MSGFSVFLTIGDISYTQKAVVRIYSQTTAFCFYRSDIARDRDAGAQRQNHGNYFWVLPALADIMKPSCNLSG